MNYLTKNKLLNVEIPLIRALGLILVGQLLTPISFAASSEEPSRDAAFASDAFASDAFAADSVSQQNTVRSFIDPLLNRLSDQSFGWSDKTEASLRVETLAQRPATLSRNLACQTYVIPEISVNDADIVVAPWGSDTNPGTVSSPLRSLSGASRIAAPGQTVLIRGGVYRSAQRVDRSGQPDKPILFAAWPGERPVFDGDGISLTNNVGLVQVHGSDLIFDGIVIQRSSARGFSVYNADRVTLRRSHIHHIHRQGYAGSGSRLTVEHNRFHDLVLDKFFNPEIINPGGISTWGRPDGSATERFVFRHNSVDRVWGECVIALHSIKATIHDNRIRECYGVGIYVDNSRSVNIQRNVIVRRTSDFDRLDNGRGMIGINIAVENYNSRVTPAANLIIANNLILGTDRGVGFWSDPDSVSVHNTYRFALVAHNVICGTDNEAIDFDNAPNARPRRNFLMNNIFCRNINNGRKSVNIGQPGAWKIRNNLYSTRRISDGLPGELIAAPRFTRGTGIVPENYRLRANSPARARGIRLPQIPFDAFCRTRTDGPVSIGFHQ